MTRTSTLPFLAVCALFHSTSAYAQVGSFEKSVAAPLFSIDAIARAAQLAPDQGACVFASNALIGQLGDADILLLRVRGDGTIIQNLAIGDAGGQGYHDVAKEVVQADKHYYVAGYTRAIDTSAAHTFTAFLIKVDTALNFVWQKNYILPGEEMYAEAVTTVGLADLLVAGKIYDGNDFQSFVMRTDSTGAPTWIKQYNIQSGETIECIRPLPGGDILLSGSVILGFELVLPFACKLNSNGDVVWTKLYNYPPGFVERSSFQFIHVSSVDDIQLVGYTDKFGAGGTDCYAVGIDSSGAVNWARTYGGSQFDEPRMVQYDPAANELVLAGNSGSFATLGTPYPMALRIATDGTLLGAALYGDTSVYLPGRFYHSARVAPQQRLLMGSRDFPADDLYLVGTDNQLANGCEYHPITPTVMTQTTSTSSLFVTVSIPEPLMNDSALLTYNFLNETLICDQPTAMDNHPMTAATARLIPSVGDGLFRVLLADGSTPSAVHVFDINGRAVHPRGIASGAIELPDGLENGVYLVRVTSSRGGNFTAPYHLLR